MLKITLYLLNIILVISGISISIYGLKIAMIINESVKLDNKNKKEYKNMIKLKDERKYFENLEEKEYKRRN